MVVDRELYYRILSDYALIRFSVFIESRERENWFGIFEGWVDKENGIARISFNTSIKL